ncbi:hypothetical protein LZ30DRAFT_739147 [Colletotrichum cereale]|nr:hypothetical protein LZ30DRAFT_739147 [Colletotrichum cereale]
MAEEIPSLLPQRWPAVRDLLADLDRCLNHLADGPGATIADIWPQLRLEFWRAAFIISSSDQHQAAAAAAPLTDVRDWLAFIRARIPDRRLQATIFSVFYNDYEAVKANSTLLTRFTKAAQDLGCSAYDVFLDFGPDIPKSTHALQHISRAFHHNAATTRSAIVCGLQKEMLARPDLRPDQPPTPRVRELTKVLKALMPDMSSRATSVAPSSRAGSVNPGSVQPSSEARDPSVPHGRPARAAGKRAAEAIAASGSSMGPPPKKRKKTAPAAENDEEQEEDDGEEEEEEEDVEGSRRASGSEPRPSIGGLSAAGSSSVQTSMSERGRRDHHSHRRSSLSLGGLDQDGDVGFGGGDEKENEAEEERDDSAEYVALCRRLLELSGGRMPRVPDPELRVAVRSAIAVASVVTRTADEAEIRSQLEWATKHHD